MRVLAPDLYRAIRDEIASQGESDVESGPTGEQEPTAVAFLLVEPALAIERFAPYDESCTISHYWLDGPRPRSRWARFKMRLQLAVEDWAFGWTYPVLTILADLGYLTLEYPAENDYALVLRAVNRRQRLLEECVSFERSGRAHRPRGGAFLEWWEHASLPPSPVFSRGNDSGRLRVLPLRKLAFLTRQLGFKTLVRLSQRRGKQRSILQLQALELSVI